MARSEMWLSLDQLEYRADVIHIAASRVRELHDNANREDRLGLLAATCWCATKLLRSIEAEFQQAIRTAARHGGAPLSADAIAVFKDFHAMNTVRKEAMASKAERAAFMARRSAEDTARAEAAAQRADAKKHRKS